jgi:hypothetical protein
MRAAPLTSTGGKNTVASTRLTRRSHRWPLVRDDEIILATCPCLHPRMLERLRCAPAPTSPALLAPPCLSAMNLGQVGYETLCVSTIKGDTMVPYVRSAAGIRGSPNQSTWPTEPRLWRAVSYIPSLYSV